MGPWDAPILLTGPDPCEYRPLEAQPIVGQDRDGVQWGWSQWTLKAASGAEVTNQGGDPLPFFLATPPRVRAPPPILLNPSPPHPKIVLWQRLREANGK